MFELTAEQKFFNAVILELREMGDEGDVSFSPESKQAVFDAASTPMKVSEAADMVVSMFNADSRFRKVDGEIQFNAEG